MFILVFIGNNYRLLSKSYFSLDWFQNWSMESNGLFGWLIYITETANQASDKPKSPSFNSKFEIVEEDG